jgi:uncharacterized protein YegJ (DUF2314 family)
MADSIRFQYAVYILSSPGAIDLAAVAHEAVARKYTKLKLVDAISKEPQAMVVHVYLQNNAKKEHPPPDISALRYFGRGLSKEQAQALQDSDEALILEFAHPKKDVWIALRTANSLIEEIARKTRGLVWDQGTREVLSADAWHEKRLKPWVEDVPDVSSQTVVHAYDNGEYVRAITLGMSKMGLPDVVVEDSDWSSNIQVGNLINIFCQSIAEGQPFRSTGEFKLVLRSVKNLAVHDSQLKSLGTNATGVACLTLKQGRRDEGDPENRLVELAFDRYPGSDVHAKEDLATSSFFGSQDSLAMVKHNAELLAASASAKAKLPELHRAFDSGLEPGEFIEVKAPFRTDDGGKEWMWVEITGWKNNEIKGLLQNEPSYVSSLHAGQSVEIREEDVFDYIRKYPDKRTEGNTTSEIIRRISEDKRNTAGRAQTAVPACATQ